MTDHLDQGRKDKERLFQVLEAYGADPARWPDNERQDLLKLCAGRDAAVEEALKAARELDAILAATGRPALDVEAARDRFLSRLPDSPAQSPPPPLDLQRYRDKNAAVRAARRLPWPAFGALAASLAAGLYVGAGGMAHEFIPALVAGEASDEELWSPAIFGDDAVSIEDEHDDATGP